MIIDEPMIFSSKEEATDAWDVAEKIFEVLEDDSNPMKIHLLAIQCVAISISKIIEDSETRKN